MGKILLLAVLICQLCTLNAQTKDETSQKVSGNLVSVPTDEDPLVPMRLELGSDDDQKKEHTITKLAKTGDASLAEFFEL